MDGTSIRNMKSDKLSWHGRIISAQPRIRLIRSFDQRNHAYLGYSLRVQGKIGDDSREFLIGIGKAAQAKHQFTIPGQRKHECEVAKELGKMFELAIPGFGASDCRCVGHLFYALELP